MLPQAGSKQGSLAVPGSSDRSPGCGERGVVESGVVDVLGGGWGALGPHAEVARVCDVKYGGEQCAKTEGWQQSNPWGAAVFAGIRKGKMSLLT